MISYPNMPRNPCLHISVQASQKTKYSTPTVSVMWSVVLSHLFVLFNAVEMEYEVSGRGDH